MSTVIYNLTKQINEILPKLCKKHGLELMVESDKIIYWDNFPEKPSDYHIGDSSMLVNAPDWFLKKAVLLIQEPQIRQILLALKDVLGQDPDLWWCDVTNRALSPESLSEALCQKWLGNLQPMFDSEPETVLTELLQILKTL
jgi:hypothetical protein